MKKVPILAVEQSPLAPPRQAASLTPVSLVAIRLQTRQSSSGAPPPYPTTEFVQTEGFTGREVLVLQRQEARHHGTRQTRTVVRLNALPRSAFQGRNSKKGDALKLKPKTFEVDQNWGEPDRLKTISAPCSPPLSGLGECWKRGYGSSL